MKRYLVEYYAGSPDTMVEYDDSTKSRIEKEGWKTLAQRNATIYQEEKNLKIQ